MKKNLIKFLLPCLVATFISISFTACSSDSDGDGGGSSLTPPEYEHISAKYTVSTASTINSIELTASGNYIIITNSPNYSKGLETLGIKKNNFLKMGLITRASYNNIIYGKFQKISETEYYLEEYGTINITPDDNDSYQIEVTPLNGNTIIVGARKNEQYTSSTATDKLCRTWEITNLGINFKAGDYTFSKTVAADNMKGLIRSFISWIEQISGEKYEGDLSELEKIGEEYNKVRPTHMTFTKSGTYTVNYINNAMGVSTWKWEQESKGLLHYSWDIENIYNQQTGGNVTIKYSGSTMKVYETKNDEDGEMKITLIYSLKEVK